MTRTYRASAGLSVRPGHQRGRGGATGRRLWLACMPCTIPPRAGLATGLHELAYAAQRRAGAALMAGAAARRRAAALSRVWAGSAGGHRLGRADRGGGRRSEPRRCCAPMRGAGIPRHGWATCCRARRGSMLLRGGRARCRCRAYDADEIARDLSSSQRPPGAVANRALRSRRIHPESPSLVFLLSASLRP